MSNKVVNRRCMLLLKPSVNFLFYINNHVYNQIPGGETVLPMVLQKISINQRIETSKSLQNNPDSGHPLP